MSDELTKRSKFGVLDTLLVGAGVVGAVFIVLWIIHIAVFAFKVAIFVIAVMLVIRLVHLLTRGRK
jgi:hypothetical protein